MGYSIPHWCTNREQRRLDRISGTDIVQWTLYADDVVLFYKSAKEADDLQNIINTTCNRFGPTISFKKTKTKILNDPNLAKEESIIEVGNKKIENVQVFTYSGQVISNSNATLFTDHWTARALSKFNELCKVLADNEVLMHTRRKILESCVRSRLTYGTQAWYPSEQQIIRKPANI